jgi:hypothetical protein
MHPVAASVNAGWTCKATTLVIAALLQLTGLLKNTDALASNQT